MAESIVLFWINNIETVETTDQISSQESQNVNYINYNEQINSDYDSLDENYVATVESVNSSQAELKNMMIKIALYKTLFILITTSKWIWIMILRTTIRCDSRKC